MVTVASQPASISIDAQGMFDEMQQSDTSEIMNECSIAVPVDARYFQLMGTLQGGAHTVWLGCCKRTKHEDGGMNLQGHCLGVVMAHWCLFLNTHASMHQASCNEHKINHFLIAWATAVG
ncbi:hypothetical protein ACJX0J_017591 [Zea mays]